MSGRPALAVCAALVPEGQRKLAGRQVRRRRTQPPDHRPTLTSAPEGAAEAWHRFSRAPSGAHGLVAMRSGGSRSLRSLHHRLISISPPGWGARRRSGNGEDATIDAHVAHLHPVRDAAEGDHGPVLKFEGRTCPRNCQRFPPRCSNRCRFSRR